MTGSGGSGHLFESATMGKTIKVIAAPICLYMLGRYSGYTMLKGREGVP